MDVSEYKQLKAFAIQDGTFLGLIWIGCFASFIGQLHNPSLSIVWIAISVFSLGYVFVRTKKFGKVIREGDLSFSLAWIYALTMFICASLLMAIANYVYFAFLDHGFVVCTYEKLFEMDEYQPLLKAYGIDKKTLDDAMTAVASLRPVEWMFNILSTNIFLGIIVSPLVAIYARQRKSNQNIQ